MFPHRFSSASRARQNNIGRTRSAHAQKRASLRVRRCRSGRRIRAILGKNAFHARKTTDKHHISDICPSVPPLPPRSKRSSCRIAGKINRYVYQHYTSLVSVTIPGNVKEIGEYAFSVCNNLSSVTIENGVESIGGKAFFDAGFSEITVPSSVMTTGYAVFGKNPQITMVHCMFPSLPEGWDANRYKGGAHGSPDVPYEWMG